MARKPSGVDWDNIIVGLVLIFGLAVMISPLIVTAIMTGLEKIYGPCK